MLSLEAGSVIDGRYRLERPLASGAMGFLWVARHLQLEVEVAIKFMMPQHASSQMARARFEREAKASAQLRTPHVVHVYDYGLEGDTPYLAMELLDGEDLAARLRRRGRLTPEETLSVVDQLCKALRRAHEVGLIHRDLKPANVFLARQGEEIVKILDFGVAKATITALSADATKTGTLIGSPHYMSPEQVRRSKTIDPRSDLWSLGVIIFQCLTGQLPFPGEELGDVLVEICTGDIPVASRVAPDVSPELDRFLERALRRDPAERFQSAGELAEAFAAAVKRGTMPSIPGVMAASGAVIADLPAAGGRADLPPAGGTVIADLPAAALPGMPAGAGIPAGTGVPAAAGVLAGTGTPVGTGTIAATGTLPPSSDSAMPLGSAAAAGGAMAAGGALSAGGTLAANGTLPPPSGRLPFGSGAQPSSGTLEAVGSALSSPHPDRGTNPRALLAVLASVVTVGAVVAAALVLFRSTTPDAPAAPAAEPAPTAAEPAAPPAGSATLAPPGSPASDAPPPDALEPDAPPPTASAPPTSEAPSPPDSAPAAPATPAPQLTTSPGRATARPAPPAKRPAPAAPSRKGAAERDPTFGF
ncbi:protein kinase [Sorangium cellulosum]|uniref:non-specific serine/threonine protein kinase n=1 Tax=Sorangium cellulosum TaxID=56 RepID=A0A2L0F8E0_SORCE|nr:serine/threonine-protein kinase [Sorangium cellulosum]AUX47699.1 protein kinase [Sorangium cellulosum]